MDENGYVTLFKDIFGNSRDKWPNDFDTWNVKKQCEWINKNITKFLPNMPQSLLNFIPAAFCQLDFHRSPEELPEWMDMDKYRRGQKFVQKHYTALLISNIMSLMYSYSYEETLRPIILGGRSHTPYLGCQKNVVLLKRILNWYKGDPWIKGTVAYKDMQVTNRVHVALRRKLCQMDHEQIAAACTFANPWCPDNKLLLKDFAAACPLEKFGQRPYTLVSKSPYKPKGINNADFAAVQCSIVSLPLLYPQNIGIYDATEEDLEAFCHVWKCYGYFLGLDDEYNFCCGSLKEIKQRVRDFHQYWTIQNFKELSPEWEHITKCLIESLNYQPLMRIPYKVMVLLSTDALNLNMPHLYASLSYSEWISYKSSKFLFYSLKFSSVRAIANKMSRKIVSKVTSYTQNAEKLTKIHKKSNKILPDFSLTY